jgi:hypothetical protein
LDGNHFKVKPNLGGLANEDPIAQGRSSKHLGSAEIARQISQDPASGQ